MEDRTLLSTLLVNNTSDSGPGSLRQAILDSNAAIGSTDSIDFHIPGKGVQTIEPASPLPAITNPVLIDGFSQPGYAGTPLIQIDGSQDAAGGDGLLITGPGVTVRGLDISGFAQGVAGIHITGASATGDWVYGNFVGTDPTGKQANANWVGVEIDSGATQNLIGTNGDGVNDVAERNLISGNSTLGIWIYGQGTNDNAVAGNFIGTDAMGTASLPNSTGGIDIERYYAGNTGANGNTIGGDAAVAGNLITNNGGPGVIDNDCLGNQITANRIFGNQGQAIDLGDDGVTDNATAPRQGPNNLQNFPIIAATAVGRLQGWLGGSLPDTTFHIDVFASAGYGPGGAGEAEDYLGPIRVTTDRSGQVVFDIPYSAPAGLPFITATATDPQGNTSEVSALRRATLDVPPPSLRAVRGQALNFSSDSGDRIAIQDPDAGPLNPASDLSLSVGAGTLNLATTAGLTGSGDGTGSLSYSGSLSDLDAALNGLR
jgi:hypothetical protein